MQLGKQSMAQSWKMSKYKARAAKFTKIPQRECPSQNSKCANNFWTDEDRRKLSMFHLQEVGVGESNGDVIFGLGRHLTIFLHY